MKNIYIIFSATDLHIGRLIRFVTKNGYNHCSVCLRPDLSRFYSFSRVYRHNPLIGGFVVESPLRYTLSSRTGVKIVTVSVTDEGYAEAERFIASMAERGDELVYNFFSAAAYPFGKSFRSSSAYTCAEFTHAVLRAAGVKMPERANIREMELALKSLPTVEGRAVDILGDTVWGEDRYLEHIGRTRQAYQIARGFKRLVVNR